MSECIVALGITLVVEEGGAMYMMDFLSIHIINMNVGHSPQEPGTILVECYALMASERGKAGYVCV